MTRSRRRCRAPIVAYRIGAKKGHRRAILNAQKDAVPFYARYGFIVTGDEFEEVGIAHRIMERKLEITPASM